MHAFRNDPGVFDHVTIRASSREASERFYATVLSALEIEQTHSGEHCAEWDDFSLAAADDSNPVTRRLHIGFAAPSREHVDRFWQTGTAAGYESDGEPGPRPQYSDDYYGAFLLDPDGNSIEAVHHGSLRNGGNVDHLWIRVSDVEAATQFYEGVGPAAGFRVGTELADRTQFACVSGSFSVVAAPSRRRTSTSLSLRRTTRPSTASIGTQPGPATATTAPPASARSTTRGITPRSCSTRTATTSRW